MEDGTSRCRSLQLPRAEVTSEQIKTLLDATNNEVEGYYPIIFANFLADPSKIATLITTPGGTGGGGGGGGGAGGDDAVEEEKEEVKKEEEEEMDLGGGGMSMFGEEEGAGGGDY
eukprot:scaffold102214_cov38-Attheya_sp.AAC.4